MCCDIFYNRLKINVFNLNLVWLSKKQLKIINIIFFCRG
ncbi:hypothetical protein SeKA_A2690 [Salmonella enterica subsp. enterica serovar Kentucky str. CVM29188]|nr:hypothetical protein SeKA_A2690 [Salmonella enterica subsp. enterica serovar Kentucky str. CVM29188]EDZ20549.1 hypothetical protein SeKB_A3307 [Salmonella enterica subsp. enterica serovar Kentucky str. CDC 191]